MKILMRDFLQLSTFIDGVYLSKDELTQLYSLIKTGYIQENIKNKIVSKIPNKFIGYVDGTYLDDVGNSYITLYDKNRKIIYKFKNFKII